MTRNVCTTIVSLLALAGGATAQIALPGEVAAAEQPAPEASQPQDERPVVEVVFVLDTTGSMSGLIEGAKQKIWSVANAIVMGEPRPAVRIGLVAYRDRTDAYVTQVTPLTDDLDAMYSKLMALEADGGGDSPESVNQALHEAVGSIAWSEDDNVLRIVYLVGDAPPHMDYEQDVKYPVTCELAAKRGLIINTIQCGAMGQTTPIWQEIARLAEGEFFQIDQSGGVRAIATPYDEELAALGLRLNATMMGYGDLRQQAANTARRERALGLAEVASDEALADRALYFNKSDASAWAGENDLVTDVEEGRVALASIPEEDLPEPLRAMGPEEREAYLAEQAGIRAATQSRIAELAAKREAYINEKVREAGPSDSFDRNVLASLRRQAARVGIRYGADE